MQPFGNTLVTLTLTGAQLLEVLKQQWCGAERRRASSCRPERALHVDRGRARAIAGQPCDGAAEPGERRSDRRPAVDPAAATGSR